MKKEDLRKVEFKDPKVAYDFGGMKNEKQEFALPKGFFHQWVTIKEVTGSEFVQALVEKENGEMVYVEAEGVKFLS